MTEVLVKFDEPIRNPAGAMYLAEAVGRKREDGLWEGWLEFGGLDESVPSIVSGRETTQPNRADLEYWAQGLSKIYLEGALARTQASTKGIQSDRASRESSRDA